MKKNIIYAAIAGTAILFASCEDMFGSFLDKQPSNDLTKAQVFGDWATAKQQHLDTYNFLRNGIGPIDMTWLDAATDLASTTFSYGVKMSFNIGNYYGGSGYAELVDVWESRYRGIRKCNMTIQYIDDVPKAIDDSQEKYEDDKKNLIAEARFLRAYFYWEMFLRYGPVPIITEVLDPDGELIQGYTTRPSVKEYVVDFVLKELRECEAGLMTFDESVKSNIQGRVCKPWARALYSRIMLYMASPFYAAESGISWSQAATASKEFIDTYGSNYELFKESNTTGTAYTNAILRTTYEGNNKETIIFRNDAQRGWAWIQPDSPLSKGGDGGMTPSQNLVDMFDMANGTSPFAQYDETGAPIYNGLTPAINTASGYTEASMWAGRDPRLEDIVLHHGSTWDYTQINVIVGQGDNPIGNAHATKTGYYVKKWMPEVILSNNKGGSSYANWIIMRYAEVLLNYAEAENEANGPSQIVYDLLDQVRHRGGITGNVIDRADLKTKEAMRKFIRKERTIELCFEEHRWWDVRRWKVAKEALARQIIGVDVAANGTISRKVAQDRVFEDKMYLYPIPETEVWKTNIENNPGW